MTRDEALAFLAVRGLRGKDAQSSLDAMLIRVGFGAKTLDRTLEVTRTMTFDQLIGYFGMNGARAARILSSR